MARSYHIVPEDYSPDYCPPTKIRQLHRERPDEHNAEIVIMENGIEIDRMMYRPDLARKYDAEIPPVPDKIQVGGKSFTQILGGEKEPDIRKGAPPIFQYIEKLCEEREGPKEKEIIDEIYERWRFDEVDFVGRGNIKSVMKVMMENTIITPDPDKETWHKGTKSLEYFYDMENEGYDIKEGPYPTIRLCRDFLEERGSKKAYKVLDFIMDWNWAVNREYGKKWINHCLDKRYIRHVGRKVLEAHRQF